jgi:hypothetical protein
LPKKCDIILCWEDDWREHPRDIEVVELRSVVQDLKKKDILESRAPSANAHSSRQILSTGIFVG